MSRLDDSVALVTGASSGIGNAIAAAFGREGATVVVADVRREPKLDDERSVFEKLDDTGAEYSFVECDVSDPAAAEAAVEHAVDSYGQLDVLVNNAGIYYQYEAEATPVEDWDAIVDVNARGTFLCSKYALPHLRESAGKVVNLASIFGLVGGGRSAAYCASKGAVANLTRQMALDYAPDEVNINALAPGIIETAQNVEWRENAPEIIAEWEAATPWPTFGSPEDVADAALFLASDESDFVTGAVLSVDGGWTSH
ncbi:MULTISPECIES: SDR family NAD(P)-dependent oxidoreductase [unclassified Haloferax]|uniref:SDR family NAD(P)-dependent oxidoreductase n=1 Tax=Haloferax sp. Atlit-48N TaxID=2077198 RepID=A0ACD5HZZ9_9EURY|nr:MULTISPECIES: SDR family NAD(P)-dependent oxidoreductase [unclassified Haloferax]RDZ30319.1 short-chain family oxidoreductase [Haloferax sp. Atlit-48N]RDZ34063.1 short-chain family oxidoreductase [Haloferax sp. Atlit-24N]RLM33668.1 SDR family NAD(P)-dependent oxidoreductase [Haloferax sp. Atlit-109R]RLM40751.1 SDR family NAD(P)-dependent oxidoreductase [Haloferax sp. Atlit-105R]